MKLELKNIKVSPSLSEETHAYTASLYVDGKRIGQVKNHGQGSEDQFMGDWEEWKRANEWCKANMPKDPIEGDLECWCCERVNDHLMMRDINRRVSKHLMFRETGSTDIYQIKWPKDVGKQAGFFMRWKRDNPNAEVINHMTAANQMDAFRAMG